MIVADARLQLSVFCTSYQMPLREGIKQKSGKSLKPNQGRGVSLTHTHLQTRGLVFGLPSETPLLSEGVSKVGQKPNPLFANVFFSVSMQNHSRTPKTCFTLGLECLCLIYSHWDSFENGPRVPNHGEKKANIIKEIYLVLKWDQA